MRRQIGVLLCTALFLAGCESGPEMAEVKGTVTLDGVPLDKGMIQFTDVNKQLPAASLEIKDGDFKGKAFVGLARVSITSPKSWKKAKAYQSDDSPEVEVAEGERIPAIYNRVTGLLADVKSGSNEFSYALRAKMGKKQR